MEPWRSMLLLFTNFRWSNRFYSQATWVDSRSGIVPLYNVRKMFDKLGIEYHHEK